MKYDAVLFDLDGTLTDSAPGITGTMQKTLRTFGIEESQTALRRYLGPPLRGMFSDYLPKEQVEEAIVRYRTYYHEDGIFNSTVYPGVPELLEGLAQSGCKLCLATAKPREAAVLILQHFGIANHFTVIGGTEESHGIFSKIDVMRAVLHQPALAGNTAVMVGDRSDDLRGAAACGVDAIGVQYGYAPKGELEAFHPVLLASSPAEVLRFLR